MSDLLTPEQLSQRWSVAIGTLTNWRTAGKGPAWVKLGTGKRGAVRYPMAAILEWERTHQKGA